MKKTISTFILVFALLFLFASTSFADVYLRFDYENSANSNQIEEERLQEGKRKNMYIISGASVIVVVAGAAIFVIKKWGR